MTIIYLEAGVVLSKKPYSGWREIRTLCLPFWASNAQPWDDMIALAAKKELPRLRRWLNKAISLVVAGLLTGWAYEWAAPRLYRPEITAGFWPGAVHGALLPVALPSLLMGQNVPIFTANNTGRSYKVGYIAGINLCGLLFFGLAFRTPKKPNPEPTAGERF